MSNESNVGNAGNALLVDAWINCNKCGHRYTAARPDCPRCNASNTYYAGRIAGTGIRKQKRLALVGLLAIASVFIVILMSGVFHFPAKFNSNAVEQKNQSTSPSTGGLIASTNIESSQQQESRDIASISRLLAYGDGSSGSDYEFYLTVSDVEGREFASDGKVIFQIQNDKKESVYGDTFDVKKEGFKSYQLPTEGNFIAYSWKVPMSELRKGTADYGNIIISFFTPTGFAVKTVEGGIQLPKFTEQELRTVYEQQYQDNSIQINRTVRFDNLELTAVRIGYFDYPQYQMDHVFRMDFRITNLGNEISGVPSDYYIIDKAGNQHHADPSHYFDEHVLNGIDQVLPDKTIEKFKLFKDIDENVEPSKLIIVAHGDALVEIDLS